MILFYKIKSVAAADSNNNQQNDFDWLCVCVSPVCARVACCVSLFVFTLQISGDGLQLNITGALCDHTERKI